VAALAIRVLTTEPVPLDTLRPDLPVGLSAVVMKAIARDRDRRYPSMQALIEAVGPYVPRGAGLLLPEGQGKPLRTPRGATPHAGSALPTLERSETALAPLAGPVSTPPSVVTGHVQPTKPPPVRWAALGAVTVVLCAGGATLLLRGGEAAVQSGNALPVEASGATGVNHPPPLPVKETPPQSPTPNVQAATQAIPATPVARGDAGVEPEPESHASKRGHHRKQSASEAQAPSSTTPAAVAEPAATSTEKAPTKAQGRAGQIGTEDF
jgi:serine/threonine-protein kinase